MAEVTSLATNSFSVDSTTTDNILDGFLEIPVTRQIAPVHSSNICLGANREI
jgi:hypothetical protein